MYPGEGGEGWTSLESRRHWMNQQVHLKRRSQIRKKWNTRKRKERTEKWIFPRMEFECWKIQGREQKHWKRWQKYIYKENIKQRGRRTL